jgi:hypothetical protein
MVISPEHTATFSVVDDDEVIRCLIYEFTNIDRFRSSEGEGRVEGVKSYETASGEDVTRKSDGTFQITGCPLVFRRA